MRTACLLLIAQGLALILVTSYYAGELNKARELQAVTVTQRDSATADTARLIRERNALFLIAKRFQRSQCGT